MLKKIWGSLLLLMLIVFEVSIALAQPPTPQALQGTWVGRRGAEVLTLAFNGPNCLLSLNGQQMPGVWNLRGPKLTMNFQNGKKVSYQVALEGPYLVLDNDVRLERQGFNRNPQPQGFGGAPQNPFGFPQNGPSSPFGFPQNTPPPPPPSSPFGFPKPLDAAPQANLYNLIQGFWSAQIPEGVRSFRFEANRYEQLLNGQVLESGIFNLTPDGRFSYQVTQGQFRGQRGENRLSVNGNTLTMFWPQGNSLTYVRGGGFNNPTPMGQSPLEGRWIWAKSGAVTFGFIFQGQNFISTWNNQERSRGTFTLTPNQIIMQHQTGPDAGKIDRLGIQISGNRFILFTSDDPNVEPIPFVRQ